MRGEKKMNNRISFAVIVVALGGIVLLSGCATISRVNLVKKGVVSVSAVPSEKVNILWPIVYQDDSGYLAYGAVQRRWQGGSLLRSHVDVSVVSPDGSVVYEGRTRDMYVPRRIPGKGINWLRFRLPLPVKVSDGYRVKMKAHSGNCRK